MWSKNFLTSSWHMSAPGAPFAASSPLTTLNQVRHLPPLGWHVSHPNSRRIPGHLALHYWYDFYHYCAKSIWDRRGDARTYIEVFQAYIIWRHWGCWLRMTLHPPYVSAGNHKQSDTLSPPPPPLRRVTYIFPLKSTRVLILTWRVFPRLNLQYIEVCYVVGAWSCSKIRELVCACLLLSAERRGRRQGHTHWRPRSSIGEGPQGAKVLWEWIVMMATVEGLRQLRTRIHRGFDFISELSVGRP